MVMQKNSLVFRNFTSKYLEGKSLVISLTIKRFIKKYISLCMYIKMVTWKYRHVGW